MEGLINKGMRNKLAFFLGVMILMLMVSCEHEDHVGLTGDLIGSIQTFDEFGTLLTDHSGYEITIEGTSPVAKTVTDVAGEFIFNDLPTGTYNFVFQKEQFQTRKIFSYRFVGGSIPTYFDQVYLSQLPTTTITRFEASVTNEGNPDPDKYTVIHFEHEIAESSSYSQPRYVAVFLGTSTETSCNNYEEQINLNTGNYDFKSEKLASGTKLYALAYSVPVSCNGYYDPGLKGYINTCVANPTERIEFVVP
jgi:hypothetical protein